MFTKTPCFVRKFLVQVFKNQFFLFQRGPPRDRRTGWFLRNFWPAKLALETSIQIETESWRHCRRNKKPPTASVSPSICIGTVCIGKRFALIRFQGTLRCQDSSPNQALAPRSTDITATNHVRNVHENN